MLEGAADERSATMRDAHRESSRPGHRARARSSAACATSCRAAKASGAVENIVKLVEEASALALVGAKDHGINVQFSFDPAVDLVLADRVQVQQVMLNLIRNAMDAMESAERRYLALKVTPEGDSHVLVSVSDTGSGIAPDVADQLFQPFVTSKRHGMGVGLSISRTIIEAHGGKIWAEPNPGGGTIFLFTLSAVKDEDVDHAN